MPSRDNRATPDGECMSSHELRRLARELRGAARADDLDTLRNLADTVSLYTGIAALRRVPKDAPHETRLAGLRAADLLDYYSGRAAWSAGRFRIHHAQTLAVELGLLDCKLTRDEGSPGYGAAPRSIETLQAQTSCIFAAAAALWSTPTLDPADMADMRSLAVILNGFTRAAQRERLDGLIAVFPAEHGQTIHALEALTNTVLRGLTRRDGFRRPFGDPARPRWQFIHHGERYYVLAFGECYPATHSRYSFGSPHAMLMFQPDSSFRRAAGRNPRIPRPVRLRIRERYAHAGRPYESAHIDTPVVAESFVLPLGGDPAARRWWEMRQETT